MKFLAISAIAIATALALSGCDTDEMSDSAFNAYMGVSGPVCTSIEGCHGSNGTGESTANAPAQTSSTSDPTCIGVKGENAKGEDAKGHEAKGADAGPGPGHGHGHGGKG